VSVGHYENFPVASLLLPARLRPAVGSIYWFARSADDLADEGDAAPAQRLAALERYRIELRRIAAGESPADEHFQTLARIVRQYALPLPAFFDLLDAFSQDVLQHRYRDFAELLDYCRRSANPVGLLMLHLYGAANAQSIAQSNAICSALQLINFWQDVAIDYAKGRIYLPQDELARFGVNEAQIAHGECNAAWRALMGFQIDRAAAMIESGAPLADELSGRIGFELRMIVQGGLRMLDKLRAIDGDVLQRRPVLRAHDWPLMFGRALLMRKA
jgi:squalene synthase HpnC